MKRNQIKSQAMKAKQMKVVQHCIATRVSDSSRTASVGGLVLQAPFVAWYQEDNDKKSTRTAFTLHLCVAQALARSVREQLKKTRKEKA
jgi:hypothetical protein